MKYNNEISILVILNHVVFKYIYIYINSLQLYSKVSKEILKNLVCKLIFGIINLYFIIVTMPEHNLKKIFTKLDCLKKKSIYWIYKIGLRIN